MKLKTPTLSVCVAAEKLFFSFFKRTDTFGRPFPDSLRTIPLMSALLCWAISSTGEKQRNRTKHRHALPESHRYFICIVLILNDSSFAKKIKRNRFYTILRFAFKCKRVILFAYS